MLGDVEKALLSSSSHCALSLVSPHPVLRVMQTRVLLHRTWGATAASASCWRLGVVDAVGLNARISMLAVHVSIVSISAVTIFETERV